MNSTTPVPTAQEIIEVMQRAFAQIDLTDVHAWEEGGSSGVGEVPERVWDAVERTLGVNENQARKAGVDGERALLTASQDAVHAARVEADRLRFEGVYMNGFVSVFAVYGNDNYEGIQDIEFEWDGEDTDELLEQIVNLTHDSIGIGSFLERAELEFDVDADLDELARDGLVTTEQLMLLAPHDPDLDILQLARDGAITARQLLELSRVCPNLDPMVVFAVAAELS